MPHRFPHFRLLILLAVSAALLGGCTLAADVTPPPDYRPPAAEQPAAAGPVYPLMAPDPANGAAAYAEKCAPCHGETGGGDGPQSAKLANPVPAIGRPEVARQAAPSDWYQIITYGNLERFMPGFVNSLSDRQRWDVLAYVLSLSAPPEETAAGQEVFAAACASCHGPDGSGGEQAPSLTDQKRLAALSNATLFETISTTDGPHAEAAALTEQQRWDAVAFTRSLTMGTGGDGQIVAQATAQPTQPAGETVAAPAGTEIPGTPQASPAAQLGSVFGTVTDGSGNPLPDGLEVTLRGYDGMQETFTQSTPIQPDGSYRFAEVEMPAGRVFMTTVETADAVYNSDIAHPAEGPRDLELPITIFEQTTDLTGLSAERLHVFFDFSTPGVMQVVELFIVSNPTGKLITAAEGGQPVLTFDLPEGAANLQFQDGQIGGRYIQTEQGFGDLAEIAPGQGQHQVLFAFELPFDRKADISLPLPLPVQAAVVMIPDAGIKASSSQLQSAGQRDVQGMTFQVLNGSDLPAGEPLTVSLSGRPQAAPGAEGQAAGGLDTNLLIGLGVFGLALIGSGLWLYSNRARQQADLTPAAAAPAAVQDDADTLMEAIIALDDLHRAGKIPESAYQQRRAELKEQLRSRLS